MTDKEKIRKEVERMHNLLPIMDGDNISINYADRICRTLEMYIDSLQEEPVSEDLEEASRNYADDEEYGDDVYYAIKAAFKEGAKWQIENFWKPADGDDLPVFDREVIALLNNGKVVYAHRPNPDGWDGRSITTGEVEHYDVQTYDKGGWNIPDVKFWLDCELPKMEE